jgi:hypothetical protein
MLEITDKDAYGNPRQMETPTTRLLAARKGKEKVQVVGPQKWSFKYFAGPKVPLKLIIAHLKNQIVDLEKLNPQTQINFRVEAYEA